MIDRVIMLEAWTRQAQESMRFADTLRNAAPFQGQYKAVKECETDAITLAHRVVDCAAQWGIKL
jgi:hypothetical protein